jgi:hypothetical protein
MTRREFLKYAGITALLAAITPSLLISLFENLGKGNAEGKMEKIGNKIFHDGELMIEFK